MNFLWGEVGAWTCCWLICIFYSFSSSISPSWWVFFQSPVGEYNQYKCQMPNTRNTINVRPIPPLHQYRPPGRGFSPEPSQQTPRRESDRHRCWREQNFKIKTKSIKSSNRWRQLIFEPRIVIHYGNMSQWVFLENDDRHLHPGLRFPNLNCHLSILSNSAAMSSTGPTHYVITLWNIL